MNYAIICKIYVRLKASKVLIFENMKNKVNPKKENKTDLPGYPIYPAGEDVYKKDKEEKELDPEDPSLKKQPNELDFTDDLTGEDLDVPGSELDDKQENVGSEDEENNYYSIGGDNHNNLEEDNA